MFPQYTPRELGSFNKINSKIKSTEMYKAETVFKESTLGKMLWGLKSSLDAMRLAAGQTLYRLMNNRLSTLQVVWSINPGSEGLTDHSTGWLMLHHSRTCLSQRSSSGDMGSE